MRTQLKEVKRWRYYISYFEKLYVRVFNLIRFIDKNHIRFNSPRAYKNLKNNEEWIVVGKILELSLNCCLIKFLENLSNYCGLQVGS